MHLKVLTKNLLILVITFAAAFAGYTISKNDPLTSVLPLAGAFGFAFFAYLLVFFTQVFFFGRPLPFQIYLPQNKLIGFKIIHVGLCIAFLGYLVACFISPSLGHKICLIGMGVGFIGFVINFASMLITDE